MKPINRADPEMASARQWTTTGFDGFSKGTFGNAGQNFYVSRAGVLQCIHQFDLNRNGYFDLVLGMLFNGTAPDASSGASSG